MVTSQNNSVGLNITHQKFDGTVQDLSLSSFSVCVFCVCVCGGGGGGGYHSFLFNYTVKLKAFSYAQKLTIVKFNSMKSKIILANT